MEARVEHGDARGRTMGFPTANMHLGHCLAPAFGVYAVRVNILEGDRAVARHDGVANFGIRPMYQVEVPLMETHLFDFDGDLYGKYLSVELIRYIRPEAKFAGLDALIAQIGADAAKAREILAKTPGAPSWTAWAPPVRSAAPWPKSPINPRIPDYRATLFLPATDFPMKAGLPEAEPKWLARWAEMDLYGKLRAKAKGRPLFMLHDGPIYANGDIHSGTGLNHILKDFVVRSQGMLGKDAPYVPGWDCHGLPIEWKVEEKFRAEGKAKDDIPKDAAAPRLPRLRRPLAECAARADSSGWARSAISRHPYTTMNFKAEAVIAREAHEVRRERAALSRLPSGDVVAGGKDRAGRCRGRVSRKDARPRSM